MTGEKASISRPLVGAIALACLLAAAGLWIVQARTTQDGAGLQMWIAAFVRVGMLMTAFWLALPLLQGTRFRFSTEMVISFVVAALALARLQLRVLIPLFVVLAIAGLLLRPRPKNRPPRRW